MDLNVDLLRTPPVSRQEVEIVERKGKGHPDTLCDALAEQLSISLCRFYREHFGFVLHHNVDKALLWGGAATPAFGGGCVHAPFELFLAGRATMEFGGVQVPVEEIAVEGSRRWLRDNFHALDPDRHVKIHCLIRPGSVDLVDLYARQQRTAVWLANDTSCGAGFAPLSDLEKVTGHIENALNSPEIKRRYPEYGEDIKIMGVRRGKRIALTLACAFIDRHVRNLSDYLDKKRKLEALTLEAAAAVSDLEATVEINTGDDETNGNVYITVTGTSAEAGDDGQVGRGNRANGLITPYRPMTLEAAAGKNPITHVGKLYNIAANRIAAAIVEGIDEVEEACCYLVSQIGRPVGNPQIVDIRLCAGRSASLGDLKPEIDRIVRDHLGRIGRLWEEIIAGNLPVY